MKIYYLDFDYVGYDSRDEMAADLRYIASQIESGYSGGITSSGSTWGLDVRDSDEEDENEGE